MIEFAQQKVPEYNDEQREACNKVSQEIENLVHGATINDIPGCKNAIKSIRHDYFPQLPFEIRAKVGRLLAMAEAQLNDLKMRQVKNIALSLNEALPNYSDNLYI